MAYAFDPEIALRNNDREIHRRFVHKMAEDLSSHQGTVESSRVPLRVRGGKSHHIECAPTYHERVIFKCDVVFLVAIMEVIPSPQVEEHEHGESEDEA
jgi:hypothetical protein